jgi:hypothetical protein
MHSSQAEFFEEDLIQERREGKKEILYYKCLTSMVSLNEYICLG